MYRYKWKWYAQSLNPYYNLSSKQLGDKFKILTYYKYNWYFGKNSSGDITKISIIKDYIDFFKTKKIKLYNYRVAQIHDTLDSLDEYIARSNLEVEYS